MHNFIHFTTYLTAAFPKWIDRIEIIGNQLHIHCSPQYINKLIYILRDHINFNYKGFIDLFGIDYPDRSTRFEIIWQLLSYSYQNRIFIKCHVNEITPVPSIIDIFQGSDWFERETYDMFGVYFENHPDLRRILTDYGFEGYPLRKDFPTSGYVEVRYEYIKKRIVQDKLELPQAARNFEFFSVWSHI